MGDLPGAKPPFILDLTRLVSRAGRAATGIDRVERAYLSWLLSLERPVFALVRTAYGFALLDRAGMAKLAARLDGAVPWGAPDALSRLRRRLPEPRQRAEADVRRVALARCLPGRLGAMLARSLQPGGVYLNVGHSNVTDRVLTVFRQDAQARIAVMIHDTIPLDYPQFQRPEVVARFGPMLRRVRTRADWILCNSHATAADVERAMARWGPVPPRIVAHLGVTVAPAAPDWPRPPGFDPARPYFIALGTIEPRKNHGFLLDLWESLARDGVQPMPQLLICGARGWRNQALFDRLDSFAQRGRDLFEVPGLTDAQLSAALSGAAGLLFPSHAEGYGLPPMEAAALGVPVLCNDLAVYREVLEDIPVYASVNDIYPWQKRIIALIAESGTARERKPAAMPTWDAHFNTVLSKLV